MHHDMDHARAVWDLGLWNDDLLWLHSIFTWRGISGQDRSILTHEERDLFHLLKMGIMDPDENDRPYPGATRAMRHTSIVADRLWSIVCQERQRVR